MAAQRARTTRTTRSSRAALAVIGVALLFILFNAATCIAPASGGSVPANGIPGGIGAQRTPLAPDNYAFKLLLSQVVGPPSEYDLLVSRQVDLVAVNRGQAARDVVTLAEKVDVVAWQFASSDPYLILSLSRDQMRKLVQAMDDGQHGGVRVVVRAPEATPTPEPTITPAAQGTATPRR
jgi:hypothetical protein